MQLFKMITFPALCMAASLAIHSGIQTSATGRAFSASHSAANPVTHTIGEEYGGGIIFYLTKDEKGVQHGFIAARSDQASQIPWYQGSCKHACHYHDNGGKKNTEDILASQGKRMKEPYAAKVCHDYSVSEGGQTFNDWFLPNLFELNQMYLQRELIGGFVTAGHRDYYWSSTEDISMNSTCAACVEFFSNGTQACSEPKKHNGHVRAIREF